MSRFQAFLFIVIISISGPVRAELTLSSGWLGNALPAEIQGLNETDFEALQNAERLFVEQRFDDCLAELRKAATAQPELPPPGYMLAMLFGQCGQIEPARNLLEQLAVEHADYPPLFQMNGEIAVSQRRFVDAELNFQMALQLSEKQAWSTDRKSRFQGNCKLGLATIWGERKNFAKSLELITEVQQSQPDNADLDIRRAVLHARLDEHPEALLAIRSAWEKNPRVEIAEVALARIYFSVGKPDVARNLLSNSFQKLPKSTELTIAFASSLLDQGLVSEAKEIAQSLDEKQRSTLSGQVLFGMIARYEGDFESAVVQFEDLLRSHPDRLDFGNLLALSLAESGNRADLERALGIAESNLRSWSNQAEAKATLGWVYHRMNRTNDAAHTLQNSLLHGTASPDTCYYFGVVLAAIGEHAASTDLLQRAVDSQQPFVNRRAAEGILAQAKIEVTPSPSSTAN